MKNERPTIWELPDNHPFAQVEMHVKMGDDVPELIVEAYEKALEEFYERERT